MQAISQWLSDAYAQLARAGITTAKLDAEIILAYTIQKDRTYLHAYPEQIISARDIETANSRLDLRTDRMPIAYIVGYREFYGRNFIVNSSTLIPRPESEQIIDTLSNVLDKSYSKNQRLNVIDAGTGSGCLGITTKLEFPHLNVTLSDIDNHALFVAKQNAIKLEADVNIIQSNLLQNYLEKPDIIIANLPYVDKKWLRSPETNFEPSLALFADDNGKTIIKKLISQADELLQPNGHIILEADPTQHDSLISYASKYSFKLNTKIDYIIDLIK